MEGAHQTFHPSEEVGAQNAPEGAQMQAHLGALNMNKNCKAITCTVYANYMYM